MSSMVEAILSSWPYAPWLSVGLLISVALYSRGWLWLHRRDPRRWPGWMWASYVGGMAAIFLALASPIETGSQLWLHFHMVQHLLLMMVAPPLIWLSAPFFPMLRGWPDPIRIYWILPLVRSRSIQQLFSTLTHPLVAWPIYVGVTWIWHVPAAFDLALRRSDWHLLEHLCFTAAALLFWFPVVRPYPSRPRWSRWLLIPYLILADVQNTILAAWLTFSSKVLYPYYVQLPPIGGLTALDDQALAGVIMWVPGSVAFLLPVFVIGLRMLFGKNPVLARRHFAEPSRARMSLPIVNVSPLHSDASQLNLLHIPWLGSALRARLTRPLLQSLLALLAVLVIYDGLVGPQLSPLNLAGVLPWIHWRGILILGLLVLGNLFCLACPFTLPRTLGRRWLAGAGRWPSWLKGKWLAACLMVLFLWSYETFALWDSPWLTAWIAIAYFVVAFLVDGIFREAAFCKYVCPIGQFNFVQSLVSPFEVRVQNLTVCSSCATKDCIRGNVTTNGCEMNLYQPQKQGNLDCTFCLDCVRACPHENIGLLAVVPGSTLWSDPQRAGVGRFSRRFDLAMLVVVLVFGAFANAAGMVGPVLEWQDRLRIELGMPPQWVVTTLFYALLLFVLPGVLIGGAAVSSRTLGGLQETWTALAIRFSYAFVPLGFSMWLAHYSFHFLTSYDTLIPATQRFARDLGYEFLGEPLWLCACCRPAGQWILHFEIIALGCGLLLSLYTAWRIGEGLGLPGARTLRTVAPWAMLLVLLYVIGIWIILQPMQMRGTLPGMV